MMKGVTKRTKLKYINSILKLKTEKAQARAIDVLVSELLGPDVELPLPFIRDGIKVFHNIDFSKSGSDCLAIRKAVLFVLLTEGMVMDHSDKIASLKPIIRREIKNVDSVEVIKASLKSNYANIVDPSASNRGFRRGRVVAGRGNRVSSERHLIKPTGL
jgi:hypothetical protein